MGQIGAMKAGKQEATSENFGGDFKRFFLRGLGALVPTLLTFAILVWVYRLINDNVGLYVTSALMGVCSSISDQPAPGLLDLDRDPLHFGTPVNEWNSFGEQLTLEYKAIHQGAVEHPDLVRRERAIEIRNQALWRLAFTKYRLGILGFLIAIILVYFVGFFLASFIGRASWKVMEGALQRIPLIRAIYPNVKQVTDFLLSERKVEFSGVVAVEYPRKGVWSLGLSTGRPLRRLQDTTPDELVTVFVPSSPAPFTGWVVTAPRRDLVELNLSIDEAMRYLISGGVIKPDELSGAPSLPQLG